MLGRIHGRYWYDYKALRWWVPEGDDDGQMGAWANQIDERVFTLQGMVLADLRALIREIEPPLAAKSMEVARSVRQWTDRARTQVNDLVIFTINRTVEPERQDEWCRKSPSVGDVESLHADANDVLEPLGLILERRCSELYYEDKGIIRNPSAKPAAHAAIGSAGANGSAGAPEMLLPMPLAEMARRVNVSTGKIKVLLEPHGLTNQYAGCNRQNWTVCLDDMPPTLRQMLTTPARDEK
jgi:hypothetical protein